MKAPTSKLRFSNATNLLDYGFSNFEYKELAKKDETLKSIKTDKGIRPSVDVVCENDCGTLISKGNDINIEQNIILPESLAAPILKDSVVGKIEFSLNGDIISECNLIAKDNIEKIGVISMEKFVIENWFELLR